MPPFRPTTSLCTQYLANGRLADFQKPLKYFPRKHLPPTPHVQGKVRGEIRQNPVYAPPQMHKSLKDIYDLLAKHQNYKALETCLKLAPEDNHEDRAEYYRRAIGLFTSVHDFRSAVAVINLILSEGHPIHPTIIMGLLRGVQHHDRRHINQVFTLFYKSFLQGKLKPDNILLGAMVNLMVESGNSPKAIEDFIISLQEKLGRAWLPSTGMMSSLIHAYAFAGDFDRALDLLVQLTTRNKAKRIRGYNSTFMELVDLQAGNSMDLLPNSHVGPLYNFGFHEKRRLSYGRTISSFPYTAILFGYRKFMSHSASPQELLHSLCRLMKLHGVYPDIEFCTTVLDILGRTQDYDRVFAVYHVLTTHPNYPFPASSTYRKLFSFSGQARTANVPSAQYFRTCGPHFFREMIFHEQALRQLSYDSKQKTVVTSPTLNAASRCFLTLRDYQSVLVVLRTFNFYGVSLSDRTVDDILEFFDARVKNSSDEDPWAKNFLYGLPRSINIHDLLMALKDIGRHPDNQAMVPNLRSPSDKATLWASMELVLRALIAEYVEIGWHLPQPVEVPETVKTQVESLIRDAANTMIPKPIKHMSNLTGWPQINDFIYTNWVCWPIFWNMGY